MATPLTVTYKTIGSLSIKLDIYLPHAPAHNVPILLWYHGGGLLQGYRTRIAPHTVSSAQKYGHVLVSPDYRLAPQTPIEDILQDALDALSWIHNDLPRQLEGSGVTVDTSRIAVSGSSAGGYLAFLVSLYSETKPKAVLAIYPITNPLGKFFTTPQPIPNGQRLDETLIQPFLDRNADQVSENDPSSPRQTLYLYMLKSANFASLLSIKAGDDTYIVADQLRKGGRRRQDFPPTYIVHGDADQSVGVEQSDEVVQALKDVGVEHVYERLAGLDHLFDRVEGVQLESYYRFLTKYV